MVDEFEYLQKETERKIVNNRVAIQFTERMLRENKCCWPQQGLWPIPDKMHEIFI